jgi:magnesium chelatase family protein
VSTLARCHSACAVGIDGIPTEVEVQLRRGPGRFDVVGLPDAVGREARDRVRSAIVTSGYPFPDGNVLVNLAPAGTRKAGAGHDLPLALAVLAARGVVSRVELGRALVFGELALDGRVRPVRASFLLAATAKPGGRAEVIVAEGNAREAALATDLPVRGVRTLREAVQHLNRTGRLPPVEAEEARVRTGTRGDFDDVRGQRQVKQALTVAAAGRHNVLLVGPPGCGKTLSAARFPDLLPALSREEALEVARLRSAAGLPVRGLPTRRPFRSPSCGASGPGILGGGNPARPGEVSLAHHGVLFLDEAPHFRGDVLEGLRGPLEDGVVGISRVGSHVRLPARFQLLLAMNPCPCGHGSGPKCSCTPRARDTYTRRISGPVLDRIDLRVVVPAVRYEDLEGAGDGNGTDAMRARVLAARAIQHRRLGNGRLNASMGRAEIEAFCRPDRKAAAELQRACDGGSLSARGVARVQRVARTIMDVGGDDSPVLGRAAVLQALGWRVARSGDEDG